MISVEGREDLITNRIKVKQGKSTQSSASYRDEEVLESR
jgi:hypothetical protein